MYQITYCILNSCQLEYTRMFDYDFGWLVLGCIENYLFYTNLPKFLQIWGSYMPVSRGMDIHAAELSK